MRQHIYKSRPGPRRINVLWTEQTAHISSPSHQHQCNQQQRRQKVGNGQPDVAHKVGHRRSEAVAVHCGVNAQRNGNHPARE